jgi:type III restriction enzyme
VIGRGLRRVRVKGVKPDEPQICAVVDHPKLEHEWLWDIFNAKRRTGVEIEDLFDETEDLPPPPPKQEFDKPEFVIDVPPVEPSIADDGAFDLGDFAPPPSPVQDWKAALDAIQYDPTAIEITKVGITGVVGRELGKEGWKTLLSAPENGGAAVTTGQVSDDAARDAVKSGLLSIAEELAIEAGYAASFKDRVYSALVQHVRAKFFNGASLGLAERSEVDFAWTLQTATTKRIGW